MSNFSVWLKRKTGIPEINLRKMAKNIPFLGDLLKGKELEYVQKAVDALDADTFETLAEAVAARGLREDKHIG
jgi:hypothetical protein